MRQGTKFYGDQDPCFRWRGTQVLRIEYLSDIVFALAFGMIVSSSNEPRTFEELQAFLFTAAPVTAAFIFMVYIWTLHFTFFRRYGLSDQKTMVLNGCLLLLVLFIAYPLRFIFDALFGWILLMAGDPGYVVSMQIDYQRAGAIMSYFAGGMALLFTIAASLYLHALSRADDLGLTDLERRATRVAFWVFAVSTIWAVLACVAAAFTPLGGFAGFIMSLARISSRFIRWRILPKRLIDAAQDANAASTPPHQTPEASPARVPDSSPVLRRDR
ncbi:MAG: TMEM175 family protein [Pseudomonadota bacterium]